MECPDGRILPDGTTTNVLALESIYFEITALYTHHFVFNDQYYLHTQGVAMGASCAPSYANLYLGCWGRAITSKEQLSSFFDHILLWYRYIDLFIVWTGTRKHAP